MGHKYDYEYDWILNARQKCADEGTVYPERRPIRKPGDKKEDKDIKVKGKAPKK
jgi:hypothetical protein